MAVLTVQVASATGVAVTYSAAGAGGDSFANTGREALHVKNGSGSSINVTVDSVTACDQGFDHNLVIAVPAGSDRIIGAFPTGRYGSSVGITYSAVTTVTVAAVRTF